MEAFRRNQAQFREAMTGAFSGGPFESIARRNIEMFEAAAKAFQPPAKGAGPDAGRGAGAPKAAAAPSSDEFSELKDQLAKLQEKRSEEHTSELQSLMRISYAVFCLKKTNKK